MDEDYCVSFHFNSLGKCLSSPSPNHHHHPLSLISYIKESFLLWFDNSTRRKTLTHWILLKKSPYTFIKPAKTYLLSVTHTHTHTLSLSLSLSLSRTLSRTQALKQAKSYCCFANVWVNLLNFVIEMSSRLDMFKFLNLKWCGLSSFISNLRFGSQNTMSHFVKTNCCDAKSKVNT